MSATAVTPIRAEEFVRYDSPEGEVLHAKIRIGDSMIEMGDSRRHSSGMVLPSMPTGIYLCVPDADAVYRRAMAAGAVSLSEPADQPYGDRLAGVQDFCGNRWYIATHIRGAIVRSVRRDRLGYHLHFGFANGGFAANVGPSPSSKSVS